MSRSAQRPHRVNTNHRAKLRDSHGREIDAYVANVSRTGFRVSTNAPLAIGDLVLIRTEDGEKHPGVIRWAEGTEAGGVFKNPALLPDRFGRLAIDPSLW
jgi:hypothetical protein